ncbi:helix-turn-helix transcriptional regulator [Streptomyces sp. 2A115]|uniref:helix-turn-helix transcriptional regulator n=1 Tax=Streptomyces sp. 2A115 TaxID=3457439 RepID=UPI003FD64B19
MTMVGRDGEQAQLSAFVRAGEGKCLVLRGESGVGKTTLLNYAAGMAARDGHLVIRATGVETESELPYAGLRQLLHPLLSDVSQLDTGTGATFGAVFGRTDGTPPSVMTLGLAVLRLLSSVASKRPLLLVLDDGHWLDDASAAVCGFVGRRLADSPVKLLMAVRGDVASRFPAAALTQTPVTALADNDAALMLDRYRPALSNRVRTLVLNQARGNPLALLELPPHLVGHVIDRLPDDLLGRPGEPLPRRLQHIYGARIAALNDSVRAELLKGALDGAGAGPGYGAPPSSRYRMRDVEEAVACGLLVDEPVTGELAFRHPLVRTSVVRSATPNQRRAAHHALARTHQEDLDRRAAHLAAATVDPDEEVAGVLEAAAESATRRGSALTAVTWLTRAAELSDNHADRSRRLDDAAFVAGHAARFGQARRLVQAGLAPGAGQSPAAVLTSGYLALYQEGEVRSTHRRITAAIERLRDGGPDRRDEVLDRLVALLLAVSQYAADRTLWERTHELLASLGDLVTERSKMYSGTWSDVIRHGAGWSGPVEQAAASLHGQEPWDVTRLAVSAYHLDILSQVRPHLQRVVDRELETGAMSSGMVMLQLIMLDQMAVGEWAAAERTGARALALEAEHGHDLFAHQTRGYLAQLAAMRGQVRKARELRTVVDSWARPRGVGFLTQIADAAGATAALSDGDYEAAYSHATGITVPGTFQHYAHQASRTLLDLVEAALHTGRAEQAREHALAARDAGLPGTSPRLALLTYGALAITADDEEEAAGMYTRAESHPAAARFPFELARVRAAYGSRLRYVHGGAAARRYLAQAADSFDRLGAVPWADRARDELRATGPRAHTSVRAPLSLTSQEREIAALAASGMTNEEIGARTGLSQRTVSTRLYRIFPALGVTSRSALRGALDRLDEVSPAVVR